MKFFGKSLQKKEQRNQGDMPKSTWHGNFFKVFRKTFFRYGLGECVNRISGLYCLHHVDLILGSFPSKVSSPSLLKSCCRPCIMQPLKKLYYSHFDKFDNIQTQVWITYLVDLNSIWYQIFSKTHWNARKNYFCTSITTLICALAEEEINYHWCKQPKD